MQVTCGITYFSRHSKHTATSGSQKKARSTCDRSVCSPCLYGDEVLELLTLAVASKISLFCLQLNTWPNRDVGSEGAYWRWLSLKKRNNSWHLFKRLKQYAFINLKETSGHIFCQKQHQKQKHVGEYWQTSKVHSDMIIQLEDGWTACIYYEGNYTKYIFFIHVENLFVRQTRIYSQASCSVRLFTTQ